MIKPPSKNYVYKTKIKRIKDTMKRSCLICVSLLGNLYNKNNLTISEINCHFQLEFVALYFSFDFIWILFSGLKSLLADRISALNFETNHIALSAQKILPILATSFRNNTMGNSTVYRVRWLESCPTD